MKTTNHSTKSGWSYHEDEARVVCRKVLASVLRKGAQAMLQAAVENEVNDYIRIHQHHRDFQGRRQVVRNGYYPPRQLETGMGNIPIRQPRIDDRRSGRRFTSIILPPYLRRISSLDPFIPAVYLRGISMVGIRNMLVDKLGEDAARFYSSAYVVNLEEQWRIERQRWNQRDLSGAKYVDLWADGICFSMGRSDLRTHVLVIVGSLTDGTKELIAIEEGRREIKSSRNNVLGDLKRRGLKIPSRIRIAREAHGLPGALEEKPTASDKLSYWEKKTANILEKLPTIAQSRAKNYVQEVYMAEKRSTALEAYKEFLKLYQAKYPRACACLKIDKEASLTIGSRSTVTDGRAAASLRFSHVPAKSNIPPSRQRDKGPQG